MARGAAEVNSEPAALLALGKRGHRHDMNRLAENSLERGMVASGTNTSWSMNPLYVLLDPETWQLMVTETDHSDATYQDWLQETLMASLLAGSRGSP